MNRNSRDIEEELRPNLDMNENLLWIGQPKQGLVFHAYDSFLIPFSLLWAGMGIFALFMFGSFDSGSTNNVSGSLFLTVWKAGFFCMALFLLIGRFIIDIIHRKNTIYGITEKRIIIKSGIFSKSIQSIDIKTLSGIEFNEKGNGSGTITLGPRNPRMPFPGSIDWLPGTMRIPSLVAIDNVRTVYNLIIS
ncbi:PH domain-containing protein [Dysgonomonas sp. ZJ709]|uniref:PH domain-containing protein n=1 Tax=Dysgonomonas sp. ZJ709 TaxID=2709797 RepID=UPI0013EBADC6|nr:PH domain-containing protein [Dysgonomonas sp. ZJ709]